MRKFISGFLLLACVACSAKAPTSDDAVDSPTVVSDAPPVNPFVLYAADDDAIHYEDMDAVEKATVDEIEEWAETQNGPIAAAAWSVYASQIGRQAVVAAAAHKDVGPAVSR